MWHSCRDFQQPCLGRRKPSCCICSLQPIRLCTQYLGGQCVCDFLIGSYLLLPQLSAQIYWVFMQKILLEFLEKIPLALRRNMVTARQGCSSFRMSVPKTPHCHLQQSLDCTELARVVACQVTRPHTILLLPIGLHINW